MAKCGKSFSGDMTISQVLKEEPKAAEVFMKMGMHCLGCPSAQGETVAQAAAVHGIAVDEILEKLNSL